jgi:hypothetical protein
VSLFVRHCWNSPLFLVVLTGSNPVSRTILFFIFQPSRKRKQTLFLVDLEVIGIFPIQSI